MSVLFTPFKLGDLEVKNRFVHSACEDNMADENGHVTDDIIQKLGKLAKGEVGLIIWSHLSVHPSGRNKKFQSVISNDEVVAGLSRLTDSVHQEGGKIAFQLGHGGLQASEAVTGQPLMGPMKMGQPQIFKIIDAFAAAARRAVVAGADAIQLHAAHGYLINEFLSPFFNKRDDQWGGSDENRFKFLAKIITAVKKAIPAGFPLLVKLNTNDYTKDTGITPPLAMKYAGWLKELSIDGLEISCGTSLGATFYMCRGDVPVDEMVQSFTPSLQPQMKAHFQNMAGKFELKEPYNNEAARMIRPAVGALPLFAVGGWRDLDQMEAAVANGDTDFISMCRPFIREPNLVKRFREGKSKKATCKNCNKCLAALPNNIPVRCYNKGFPK